MRGLGSQALREIGLQDRETMDPNVVEQLVCILSLIDLQSSHCTIAEVSRINREQRNPWRSLGLAGNC